MLLRQQRIYTFLSLELTCFQGDLMTSNASEMCFRVYLVHVVSILSLGLEHAEACEAIFNQNCLLTFSFFHGSQDPLIEEAGLKIFGEIIL